MTVLDGVLGHLDRQREGLATECALGHGVAPLAAAALRRGELTPAAGAVVELPGAGLGGPTQKLCALGLPVTQVRDVAANEPGLVAGADALFASDELALDECADRHHCGCFEPLRQALRVDQVEVGVFGFRGCHRTLRTIGDNYARYFTVGHLNCQR